MAVEWLITACALKNTLNIQRPTTHIHEQPFFFSLKQLGVVLQQSARDPKIIHQNLIPNNVTYVTVSLLSDLKI